MLKTDAVKLRHLSAASDLSLSEKAQINKPEQQRQTNKCA